MATMNRSDSYGLRHVCVKLSVSALFVCLWVLALSPAIQAMDFECLSPGFPGATCLTRAIIEANGMGGDNTIILGAGPYPLFEAEDHIDGATGLPSITSTLTIRGQGADLTTISRSPTSVDLFRIFRVADGGRLTLKGLIIGGGMAQGDTGFFSRAGGGILVEDDGDVSLNDVFLINNTASSQGGGIYLVSSREGNLTVDNSCICNNTALGENLIQSGDGGGIFGGSLIVINSLIQGNRALGAQGGIGGGMAPVGLTMTGSTVSFNTAGDSGGGIFVGGRADITNSTISDNTANQTGGGIHAIGTGLSNVTISNNRAGISGGGIFDEGATAVKSTLIVNNLVGGNCSRPLRSAGHNIDSDRTCGLTAPGDQSGVNLLLAPLRFNGGPTPTQALLPGNPAINTIPPTDCTDLNGQPITTDQRGVDRPQGVACDIGAFELLAALAITVETCDCTCTCADGEKPTFTATSQQDCTDSCPDQCTDRRVRSAVCTFPPLVSSEP